MNVKTLSIPLFLILFCCMLGCRNKHHNKMDETARDLPQIKDSGELVVLTLYSSTSYFIYRGQEMAFVGIGINKYFEVHHIAQLFIT